MGGERVRPEHDRARCKNDPVPASSRRPLAGTEIPSPYRPPRPITHMSTGYWWNGHRYYGPSARRAPTPGYWTTALFCRFAAPTVTRNCGATTPGNSSPSVDGGTSRRGPAAACRGGAIYAATIGSCYTVAGTPRPAQPDHRSLRLADLLSRGSPDISPPAPVPQPNRPHRPAGVDPGRSDPHPSGRAGADRAQPARRRPGSHRGPGHVPERSREGHRHRSGAGQEDHR